MRASPRLLADCEAELKRNPDGTGQALLNEYKNQERRFEIVVEDGDFSRFNYEDGRLGECNRRLKNWYENRIKQMTERAKRKSDA